VPQGCDATGEVVNDTTDGIRVNNAEFKILGPFDVAAGAFFEVSIAAPATSTSTSSAAPSRRTPSTTAARSRRPRPRSATRRRTTRPARPSSTSASTARQTARSRSREVHQAEPERRPRDGSHQLLPLEAGNTDSPFTPAKLGIYAAASHLGWMQDTFKAAYPAGESGNTADTWALQYGKFKNRTSMPKGNHPRFEQGQFRHRRRVVRARHAAADHVHRAGHRTDELRAVIKPEMATHQTQMATQGWGALQPPGEHQHVRLQRQRRPAELSHFAADGAEQALRQRLGDGRYPPRPPRARIQHLLLDAQLGRRSVRRQRWHRRQQHHLRPPDQQGHDGRRGVRPGLLPG